MRRPKITMKKKAGRRNEMDTKEYMHQYYIKNKEKLTMYARKYEDEHKEEIDHKRKLKQEILIEKYFPASTPQQKYTRDYYQKNKIEIKLKQKDRHKRSKKKELDFYFPKQW